jgi:2-polyprenyl-3-methyl-5-hydroxy-6-metoxy-1,4-benzoquinol methylase
MQQSHALGSPWQKWRVMSTVAEGHATDRFDFYASQYTRFGSEVASSVRREVYGEDIGQQGWRTLDEQAVIANLILESSPCHVLDIGCGSGGPSLSLVKQTGCRLTGVDAEVAGIDRAGQQAMAQGLSHRARFEIADCSERLPYPDETFDVVICIDAVLHLKNRFSALADWCRLLRPQGRVNLSESGGGKAGGAGPDCPLKFFRLTSACAMVTSAALSTGNRCPNNATLR